MTTVPSLPDECWPLTYPPACASSFDADAEGYNADLAEQAQALAVATLRVLTAYRVGGCPVVLRPATRACCEATWGVYPVGSPGGPFTPLLTSGQWINVACGCSGSPCSCTGVSEVELPGIVGQVVSVQVGVTTLPSSAWRVDGDRLVRLDGGSWPRTQNLAAEPGEAGVFAVTYLPAEPVDGMGALAAGMLACEYFKSLSGDKSCALPKNTQTIVRNNVTMNLADPQGRLFPNGLTGIPIVDTYVARFNPHGLRSPSTVWSPDLHAARASRA